LPYPALGPIEYRDNGGNSIYHGGELTLEKRFSGGLSFRGAYTYSKSIDESQEHLAAGGTGSFTQNSYNLRERRGPSDFDIRHHLALSYIYEFPFGKGKTHFANGPLSYVLGGWRISGTGGYRSGRPFTLRAGGNDSAIAGARGGGLVSAFADCLRDGSLSGSARTIDKWFDPTAYAVPSPARLGTCGRNTLRGPSLTNFDMGLARTFSFFGEGRNLEIRWEMFNMFNTPQFALPERNISNTAGVARITALAGDPRIMQFAAKFTF
jgi:hypothetical protein